MSKRKSSRTCEEEMEHLMRKMRKLERKIKGSEPPPPPPIEHENDMPTLEPSDWLSEVLGIEEPEAFDIISNVGAPSDADLIDAIVPQETPGASELQTHVEAITNNELDNDVLEILGEDPSVTERHGKEVRHELSCRIEHISTEGLTKETRKELISRYPIPANCLRIDAPKINPEIKIAVPENLLKRDRGIELKQKQMASAISCLGEIITAELNCNNNDKEKLKKLMDLSRLLCDIQHGDSVTRRNFVLFSLKKDLREHLSNTKIDGLLFSETLADTLKMAKSINKSGIELKADSSNKNAPKQSKTLNQKSLNRKAPGPAYRQPGPSQRSNEPVFPIPRAPRPLPPPIHSSRRSWRQLPPPPAPAQTQTRRRY